MSKSNIEWTDETKNIGIGCTKVSEGCKNCYAEKMTKRLTAMGQKKYAEGFSEVVFHPEELKKQLEEQKKLINELKNKRAIRITLLCREAFHALLFRGQRELLSHGKLRPCELDWRHFERNSAFYSLNPVFGGDGR